MEVLYETTGKDDDPDDFQFNRKRKGEKTLDVCDEESFDMLYCLYLLAIQRIGGSSR